MRGSRGGGEPLGRAHIRRAVHADLAGGAGKPCRPLHRVIAVVSVIAELGENAVRSALASHVLYDHQVAVGGEPIRGAESRRLNLCGVLAVLSAHQDDRHRVFELRAVDIGTQDGAVAHGGGHIGFLGDRAWAPVIRRRP
ncbi:Uncharacterised protein [Mycobacteroides abscessus subsp. massiliense]|nr:Uncharacterised protein [Mycobacteroides abscessus subsp. massiliense]